MAVAKTSPVSKPKAPISSKPVRTATPKPSKPVSAAAKPDRTVLSGEKPGPETSDRVSNILSGLGETSTADAKPVAGKPASPNAEALKSLDTVTSQDHKDWGEQTTTPKGQPIEPGLKENDESRYKTVGEYWKGTALEGTDGKDRDQPWSAAYISSAHKRAGITNFPASIRHSTYIKDAVDATKSGDKTAPYAAHRPNERAPEKGDLVCFGRKGSTATFDDQQGGKYASHCDFVKKVGDGYIETLGGNVGDSVSTRRFSTDDKGMLNDENQRWIAVLAPQNLETQ
jgi:chitosanase